MAETEHDAEDDAEDDATGTRHEKAKHRTLIGPRLKPDWAEEANHKARDAHEQPTDDGEACRVAEAPAPRGRGGDRRARLQRGRQHDAGVARRNFDPRRRRV